MLQSFRVLENQIVVKIKSFRNPSGMFEVKLTHCWRISYGITRWLTVSLKDWSIFWYKQYNAEILQQLFWKVVQLLPLETICGKFAFAKKKFRLRIFFFRLREMFFCARRNSGGRRNTMVAALLPPVFAWFPVKYLLGDRSVGSFAENPDV